MAAALAPGFGPFQGDSYLTPSGDPQSSVWVCWNTLAPETGSVAWGPTEALGDTLAEASPGTIHAILIEGLQPGAACYYRILPSGDIHQFRSFQPPGPAPQGFGFQVIGDTRTDSVAHSSVVTSMLPWECAFYLHLGDLVEDGGDPSDWETFFEIEHPLSSSRQILPTLGNHDAPYLPYLTLFQLPGAERYYSLDYGNCHLVALDTESDLIGPQIYWLSADLQAAAADPFVDWIVVFFHRPAYSSGSHGSQRDVRDAWCGLFSSCGVDLVFCGHDHDYERTYPIAGVTYIVSGGGGAPLHHVGANPWTAYSESCFQHTRVQVSEESLLVEAVRPDGTVFDSVVIQQSGTGEPAPSPAGLAIMPNPSTWGVAVSWTGAPFGSVLRIYDVSGRCLARSDLQSEEGSMVWSRDGTGYPAGGIYLLVMDTPSERIVAKAVLL
jgi:hypothetical protein